MLPSLSDTQHLSSERLWSSSTGQKEKKMLSGVPNTGLNLWLRSSVWQKPWVLAAIHVSFICAYLLSKMVSSHHITYSSQFMVFCFNPMPFMSLEMSALTAVHSETYYMLPTQDAQEGVYPPLTRCFFPYAVGLSVKIE